jgi:flagellar basal body-associated protein FliL
MVRIIISALWVCLITAGSVYGVVMWKSGQTAAGEKEEFFGGLDYVTSPTISVPVIDDGKIRGYVVAEFVYTAKASLLKQLSVPPDVFLTDEAFRAIYGGSAVDFDDLKKYDLEGLRATIRANVNQRFGADMIKDVLVEQFNYVPMNQIRFGPKRKES